MIELPELGVPGMWETLLDIAERVEDGWTLVGGPKTLLHALEHGIDPPRVSRDLDVIVDIRARPAWLPAMLAALDELGFSAVEVSVTEAAHRFARGETSVDLLAPDGLGKRADLRTFGRATTSRSVAAATPWRAASASRSRSPDERARFTDRISPARF